MTHPKKKPQSLKVWFTKDRDERRQFIAWAGEPERLVDGVFDGLHLMFPEFSSSSKDMALARLCGLDPKSLKPGEIRCVEIVGVRVR